MAAELRLADVRLLAGGRSWCTEVPDWQVAGTERNAERRAAVGAHHAISDLLRGCHRLRISSPSTACRRCTAGSAGRDGGGTGRAERLPQGGQVSGVPGPPGGWSRSGRIRSRAVRISRLTCCTGRIASTETRSPAVAIPAQDRRCHLMVERKALGDDLRGVIRAVLSAARASSRGRPPHHRPPGAAPHPRSCRVPPRSGTARGPAPCSAGPRSDIPPARRPGRDHRLPHHVQHDLVRNEVAAVRNPWTATPRPVRRAT